MIAVDFMCDGQIEVRYWIKRVFLERTSKTSLGFVDLTKF